MPNDGMQYPESPVPAEKRGGPAVDRNPNRAITTDDDGRMAYSSAAASGDIEIILPSLPGSPNGEERLLVKNFGQTVIGKIESQMKQQGYLRSGPQQDPPGIFAHYLAVARGAALLDAGGLNRMATLAEEFKSEPNREEYYTQVIKPWLGSLVPRRRQP